MVQSSAIRSSAFGCHRGQGAFAILLTATQQSGVSVGMMLTCPSHAFLVILVRLSAASLAASTIFIVLSSFLPHT